MLVQRCTFCYLTYLWKKWICIVVISNLVGGSDNGLDDARVVGCVGLEDARVVGCVGLDDAIHSVEGDESLAGSTDHVVHGKASIHGCLKCFGDALGLLGGGLSTSGGDNGCIGSRGNSVLGSSD